jgi:glycosyltransferase involved in cell wall biosynthesis
LLFDPDRRDDLETTLERLLTDAALQTRLRQLGPARAAQFSWERAARQTQSAFHAVAAARGQRVQPLSSAALQEKERLR